jgi:hypothetical protein
MFCKYFVMFQDVGHFGSLFSLERGVFHKRAAGAPACACAQHVNPRGRFQLPLVKIVWGAGLSLFHEGRVQAVARCWGSKSGIDYMILEQLYVVKGWYYFHSGSNSVGQGGQDGSPMMGQKAGLEQE